MNIFIAFLDCMDVFFMDLVRNEWMFVFMDLVRNEQVNVMASKCKEY